MTNDATRCPLSWPLGWRMPPNTLEVDRTTPWGNPYQAGVDGDGNRAYLVDCFRAYISRPEQAVHRERAVQHLRGKSLAWCAFPEPGQPDICHAAVLLEIANEVVEQ